MTKVKSLTNLSSYKYLFVSLFLMIFLLSIGVETRSENATNVSNENPFSIIVLKDYFEIAGVFLDVGILLLLWKTVKDFSELAKVSKLQTEVRFRPWVGPSSGYELLMEDNDKKQYSIALKNFGEIPAQNVVVTCSITDLMLDKLSFLNSNNDNNESKNQFQLGPLLPGMEKRYWIFIENERYMKVMEGTSNLFIFIYFSYIFSGRKSGYGMISQLDNKTTKFVHKEMWID
ncbi:MAG: hypothetical protein ACRD97_05950 [Nitrososphaeraceae archaeon]